MRYLTFLLLVVLLSCKKDKLKGDYAVMEGIWDWRYTESYYGGGPTPDTTWPSSANFEYQINMLKKGKAEILLNFEEHGKYRIVFDKFHHNSNGNYEFTIFLDNDPMNIMDGVLYGPSHDTLMLFERPYDGPNNPIMGYRNIFVRQ